MPVAADRLREDALGLAGQRLRLAQLAARDDHRRQPQLVEQRLHRVRRGKRVPGRRRIPARGPDLQRDGQCVEPLDGRAGEQVRLPRRRAQAEDRRQAEFPELVVELELAASHVEETAEVDVVRTRLAAGPHDLEIQPVVGAVDTDDGAVEGTRDRGRVTRVHVLVAVEPGIATRGADASLVEEGDHLPPDRSGRADDRDHGPIQAASGSFTEETCENRALAIEQQTASERVLAGRERYVPRGIATTPLVVAQAEGARLEDVDGRTYIDFAGGLGCQNTGHGFPPVVAAIHKQVDSYLHQCFMVGVYEPYVEVCRRLAELSPCRGEEQKSLLLNSGAEAVENAVKIARAATGRPGVVGFENAFHGRTLLTMTMTHKESYKRGFGPFASEVHRAPGPYPYRGVTADDSLGGVEALLAEHNVACVVLEPVQGEGGFIPLTDDFPARLLELCRAHGALFVADEVQSGVGRTGPVWAIEHYGVEPDLLVSGKSLGGGLPLAAVTGPAEIMDAPEPGGLGGTFGGNPVACAAALAVLDEVSSASFRARAEEVGRRIRARLDELAAAKDQVGDVRGLGPMLAFELVADRETKEPAADLAKAVTTRARELGLVLLSCGTYGNVIRILVPLVITDEDLEHGLGLLEQALVDAGTD
jgi:4-aminobutyrate aminotransferase/(S)-3-amino-2-methylpropionate transaminase